MKISTTDLKRQVMNILHTGVVPYIMGAPGTSKSAQIAQIAKENKLMLIDIRLAQSDPVDLNGLPFMNHDTGKASFYAFDMFPLEGDPIPEGYNGWLILLDELGQAPMSVQLAAFKLILDKQVGMHKLHKNVAIIAAGNRREDKAGATKMSTALQSRMAHFEIELDHEGWLDWAYANGIDYRITSYVNFKQDALNDFKPDHSDFTFACPRTWEFMSNIIKRMPALNIRDMATFASVIGEGQARNFFEYTQIYESLPTIEEIIANPMNAKLGLENSAHYAISGLIGHNFSLTNAEPLMKYVERLGIEFQVVTMRNVVKRVKKASSLPVVSKWMQKVGEYF